MGGGDSAIQHASLILLQSVCACVRACVRVCGGEGGNAIHHTRQFCFKVGIHHTYLVMLQNTAVPFCRIVRVFRWPAHQKGHKIMHHLTHWISY